MKLFLKEQTECPHIVSEGIGANKEEELKVDVPFNREDEFEDDMPFTWVLWGRILHISLNTLYFLAISCIAIAIDLWLHWFERLSFVERYGFSPIIKWEIEHHGLHSSNGRLLPFLRSLIQPVADVLKG